MRKCAKCPAKLRVDFVPAHAEVDGCKVQVILARADDESEYLTSSVRESTTGFAVLAEAHLDHEFSLNFPRILSKLVRQKRALMCPY
jgi:hypothetical protein